MIEASLAGLRERAGDYKKEWLLKKPFPYIIMEDFLDENFAEAILAAYPKPAIEGWDQTTFIHQRKRFTLRSNFPEPISLFFTMTETSEFLDVITQITGIEHLISGSYLLLHKRTAHSDSGCRAQHFV